MKVKNYSAPLCEVRKSGLRASILAGSQLTKGKDFEPIDIPLTDENIDKYIK